MFSSSTLFSKKVDGQCIRLRGINKGEPTLLTYFQTHKPYFIERMDLHEKIHMGVLILGLRFTR